MSHSPILLYSPKARVRTGEKKERRDTIVPAPIGTEPRYDGPNPSELPTGGNRSTDFP